MSYNDFLYWILGKSFTVSLLILIILGLKYMFKNKLSPKWHYYIWLLVFIQLVTPYAMESKLNILKVQNLISGYEWFSNKTPISNSLMYGDFDSMPDTDSNEAGGNGMAAGSNVKNDADTKPVKADIYDSIVPIISRIWLLGVLALSTYNILVYCSLSSKLKKGKPIYSKELMEVIDKCKICMNMKVELQVIETSIINSPSVVGILKPKLLLPPDTLVKITKDQLQFIIYHELSHIKRKDLIVNWLAKVFCIMHWFNPILWYGFNRMSEDSEIACDAYSLQFIEKEKHKDYGYTIIEILDTFSQTKPTYPVIGMPWSKSDIKRRIERIKDFGKPANTIVMGAITLLIILGSLLLKNPLVYSIKQDIKLQNQYLEHLSTSEGYPKELQEASEDIKAFILSSTQGIGGENDLQLQWPVVNSGQIAVPFGESLYQKELLMHPGLDILSRPKADVIAAEDGEVIYAGYRSVYGLTVIINHGNRTATVYGQLSEMSVEKNDHVKAGAKIGKVGSTGYSETPHLHFELRKDGEPVNPLTEYKEDAPASEDGPGVVITMVEKHAVESKAGIESITNKLINELLLAGTEGIYINSEPITASSQIRCVGPALKINDKIMALPYKIKAVGDPQKLSRLLNNLQMEDEVKKAGIELSIN